MGEPSILHARNTRKIKKNSYFSGSKKTDIGLIINAKNAE